MKAIHIITATLGLLATLTSTATAYPASLESDLGRTRYIYDFIIRANRPLSSATDAYCRNTDREIVCILVNEGPDTELNFYSDGFVLKNENYGVKIFQYSDLQGVGID